MFAKFLCVCVFGVRGVGVCDRLWFVCVVCVVVCVRLAFVCGVCVLFGECTVVVCVCVWVGC